MGYQTAPHGSLGLFCGLNQFMSLTEGTGLLFESKSGLLIRFLAWIKLAQAKLLMSHCILNCSNHV